MIRRALLLALPLSGSPEDPTVELLRQPIGGIPLLKRQVRLLQALGVAEIAIACPAAAREPLSRALAGRLAVNPAGLDWLAGESTADLRELATRQLSARDEPLLIWSAFEVLERRVLDRAIRLPLAATELQVARSAGGSPLLLASCGSQASSSLTTLLSAWPDVGPIGHGAATFDVATKDHAGRVTDRATGRAAEHQLWEGCRKPLDGFVSRHLNRHVSLFLSRRLAGTPITPNQISIVNLVLGLAGGLIATQGTYWAFLVAALLLKLNSILDGVDGELARMRIQSSVLGEWLDTVSDDASNQFFFLGVGLGAWRAAGDPLWLILAAASALPMALVAAYYYVWCIRNKRGDILAFQWTIQTETLTEQERREVGLVRRILGFFKTLFRKDTFVLLFLLAALAGVLPYIFYVVAPAAWVTLVMLGHQHWQHRQLARG